MELLKILSDTTITFLNKYNYVYYWWHLVDNYLPISSVCFIENSISWLSFFFDKFFNFLILLNNIPTHFLGALDSFFFLGLNSNMVDALSISLKFLVCIALLIFARGGIPRFRFDYLTKLGWIRFLSLVLLSFLIELLILSMA